MLWPRQNRQERGVQNARFLKGHIEQIPLPDASVDVIISNCVINLSGDKPRVLREAFRVLKPGGRFAVSDVVVQGELPAALRKSMELWAGCIAGALEETTYRQFLVRRRFCRCRRGSHTRLRCAGPGRQRVLRRQPRHAVRLHGADRIRRPPGERLCAREQANRCHLQVHRRASQRLLLDRRAVDVLRGLRQGGVLRDRIRVNILRVRLPLNVVNAAGQRATGRTLTAPYYGWVLVGALGVTETISWGVLYYAFSVFLTPMETDLGWSRAETTGAFSLALVLSGCRRNRRRAMAGPPWCARVDDRRVVHGRRAGAGLGVSQHIARRSTWCGPRSGVVMAAVLYDPAFAVITVWFDRKRVRALTAVTLIAGFCEHDFSAALRVAGGSPGLASGAGLTCGHPGRRHHPRACAPASASTRRSGAASRMASPLSRVEPAASRQPGVTLGRPCAIQHSAG